MTVFDVPTYLLVLASIALLCLLFILLSTEKSLGKCGNTVLYVLAAFFQVRQGVMSEIAWTSVEKSTVL